MGKNSKNETLVRNDTGGLTSERSLSMKIHSNFDHDNFVACY